MSDVEDFNTDVINQYAFTGWSYGFETTQCSLALPTHIANVSPNVGEIF